MEMSRAGMIDCKEAERRLHGYLDRELTEEEAAEVRGHLSMCDNCRARFRFEEGLRRLVHRVGQAERAPAELRERIRALRRRGGS
jgi:anti-sigma factor (TIGR02949 family)